MFFRLANQEDLNFPEHHVLGKLVLNTDAGWHHAHLDKKIYVYKGYVDALAWDAELLSTLVDHQHLGNFAVFCFDTSSEVIELHTNRWRGFLIWADPDQGLSNLFQYQYTIWNDSNIRVTQDLTIIESKLEIIAPIDDSPLDASQALQEIDHIIGSRVQNFLASNNLPLKVFCSGGVDSTLVWSYIKQHTDNYELVLENRVQWDKFWCKNSRRITQQFWGYRQIHHWLEPCVLSSGAPGDEFMFRSPTTVGLWCRYNNIDIFDLISDVNCLHHQYFQLDRHLKLFARQQTDQTLDAVMRMTKHDFVRYLCNIIVNDCQHWHLGNTLTFTPLRDLRIFQTLLRMPSESLISQMLNSEISRALIAQRDQDLLMLMSDIKNVDESLCNLARLMPR